MRTVDWVLIGFLVFVMGPALVMATWQIYEMSELKHAIRAWRKRREWKETHKFIEKIKEVTK